MVDKFDPDDFSEFMFVKYDKSTFVEGEISTKDLSSYLECTERHIQKWCKSNKVKFVLKGGRKYYLWNDEKLEEFGEWFNRKINKPKKKYYVPVVKEKKQEKKKIDFITTRDVLEEMINVNKLVWDDVLKIKKSRMRNIQYWCKENNVPFKYFGKKKYYIISPEIKSYLIKNYRKIFKNINNPIRKKLNIILVSRF